MKIGTASKRNKELIGTSNQLGTKVPQCRLKGTSTLKRNKAIGMSVP